MKIFLAGASGAVGRRLVPLLVAGGHHVVATTRTPDKLNGLRSTGAEPVLMDGLDRESVMKAVVSARPDVIVHQMTALASMRNLKKFDDEFALTNRLADRRHQSSRRPPRAWRALAGSWRKATPGGRTSVRADASRPRRIRWTRIRRRRCARASTRFARSSTSSRARPASTVSALRYGSLYGPGTSISADGDIVAMVRQRKFPLVGSGAGVWSFIHVDDAARATQLAIERGARRHLQHRRRRAGGGVRVAARSRAGESARSRRFGCRRGSAVSRLATRACR